MNQKEIAKMMSDPDYIKWLKKKTAQIKGPKK